MPTNTTTASTYAPMNTHTVKEYALTNSWSPIIGIYCVYIVITFIGWLIGINMQVVGAMLFLLFITLQYGHYLLPLPLNWMTFALVLALLTPLISMVTGAAVWGPSSAHYALKYLSLIFLILLSLNLRLPPLYREQTRFWGLGMMLALLLLGLVLPGGISGERLDSIFVNPNNFALAAMSLLFFMDSERDSRWFKYGLHAVVLFFILISGTAGALLAYIIGVCFNIFHSRYARSLTVVIVAFVIICGGVIYLSRNIAPNTLMNMGPIGSMLLKVTVMQDNLTGLTSNAEINYWEIGRDYGGGDSTSAVWRLMQWRDTFEIYAVSGWLNKIVGHGIGSSEIVTSRLPHNDYLRVLLELGLLGIIAIGIIGLQLYRRTTVASRWVLVIMAAYAITENNLDNFLVMSLFVLFVTSATARNPKADAPAGDHPAIVHNPTTI